ncbi:long-chain-fatty-acid--CoA ligase [Pseudomonas vancouverensis]|uniref:Long-chain-fatty-acid--CoA ligase n=1 Tax=Pseudomonas vancouverensis TaxID=95300 RepID=A0A1H2NHA3_PSEVA|nr:long-chain-fatty-acid--CoA ligase [Pseudomonas vancouverensis]KAB0489404.1 long-chain-fatty-acid--CoA ligase [Pseudomonas vancouverensis]TDB60898.1 long-chain-fatty-acid--CoA ligase [Pseudomonas vancouverensis]SDV04822.1 long-chain acyl-CoA synthetase [Pseudomonas vancouverensis]
MYMTQCLQRTLQQDPEHIATIFGDRRRSYREFGDRVARLAHALQQLGMAAGDRVGMLGLNSDRYLEYIMGVWWGGGVLNPVNTRWSVAEIVYSLDDCGTAILLVDEHFAGLASAIAARARLAPLFIYAGDGEVPDGMLGYEQLLAAATPVEDAGRGGEDLACIMYTGGTTGSPKGVMQSHLNLWAACMPRMVDMPPIRGGLLMHVAPLFHVAGMARALIQFLAGESHVLVSSFEPLQTLQIIERERVTETLLVPTMILALLADPAFDRHDLSSLKRLTYGASPSASDMVEQVLARLPDIELSHSYGLTEACPVVSSNLPCNHTPEARISGLSRSVGRGGLGVNVKIVDPQGNEVPRGTVGEIIVRGANIMQGYWNRPEETARALRDGWLYTGDAAWMDEQGYLFIVDRLKDMIVSGGENVYSAEVENVLARHPAVAMCSVIGVPHAQWGEAVHAVVVRKPGVEVDEDELRLYCREFIAPYKCPKTVEFRDELPLSAAGKVLKRELRK